MDLIDHDQRRALRLHEIPFPHEYAAGAPRDRCANDAIRQIELRGLDRRLVSSNGRRRGFRRRGGLVGLGLRDVVFLHQREIPIGVSLRVVRLRLIAGQDAERLV